MAATITFRYTSVVGGHHQERVPLLLVVPDERVEDIAPSRRINRIISAYAQSSVTLSSTIFEMPGGKKRLSCQSSVSLETLFVGATNS